MGCPTWGSPGNLLHTTTNKPRCTAPSLLRDPSVTRVSHPPSSSRTDPHQQSRTKQPHNGPSPGVDRGAARGRAPGPDDGRGRAPSHGIPRRRYAPSHGLPPQLWLRRAPAAGGLPTAWRLPAWRLRLPRRTPGRQRGLHPGATAPAAAAEQRRARGGRLLRRLLRHPVRVLRARRMPRLIRRGRDTFNWSPGAGRGGTVDGQVVCACMGHQP